MMNCIPQGVVVAVAADVTGDILLCVINHSSQVNYYTIFSVYSP